MDAFLRVGLELPALPALGIPTPAAAEDTTWAGVTGVLSRWRSAAVAAAETGCFGALWLAGGPGSREDSARPGASGATCDPCTLAAGLAGDVRGLLLGVVSVVGAASHPAVAARDLTALDVVSGGRAAVLLAAPSTRVSAGPEGLAGPLPPLTPSPDGDWLLPEAAAVCRAVFREDRPRFEGRWFHVAGAVNRPPPVRPGGPPILVSLGPPTGGGPPGSFARPAPMGDAAAMDADALALALEVADAVVVTGRTAQVARWRRVVDRRVPLVWRGPLGAPTGAGRAADAATRLLDAGADGLIVQPVVPADTWRTGEPARRLGSLAEALAPVVAGATS